MLSLHASSIGEGNSPQRVEEYMPVPVYSSPLEAGQAKPRVQEVVRWLSSVEFKLLEMPKVAVQLAQTGSSRRIHSRPEPIYHQRKESLLDLDCVTQEDSRESLSPPMVITQLAPPRQPEVELKITLMQRNLGDTEEGVGGTAGGLTSRPHSSGSSHDSLNEASMQQHTQIQNAVYSS